MALLTRDELLEAMSWSKTKLKRLLSENKERFPRLEGVKTKEHPEGIDMFPLEEIQAKFESGEIEEPTPPQKPDEEDIFEEKPPEKPKEKPAPIATVKPKKPSTGVTKPKKTK